MVARKEKGKESAKECPALILRGKKGFPAAGDASCQRGKRKERPSRESFGKGKRKRNLFPRVTSGRIAGRGRRRIFRIIWRR